MPTPSFNITQDASATFAAMAMLADKTDRDQLGNIIDRTEAELDDYAGARWGNGVDEALIQINEACQGERFVDAWAVNAVISGAHADADNACVGTTATANNGITIRSTGLSVLAAADAGDNDAGRFQYDHSGTPQWEVWVEGTEVANLRAALACFVGPAQVGSLTAITAHATADDLVLGGSTSPGMTIKETGTTGTSRIIFADNASNTPGQIVYDHNGDVLYFFTGEVLRAYFIGSSFRFDQASCSLALGNSSAAGAGEVELYLDKGAASNANIHLRSNEGGTYQTRGLIQLGSGENIAIQHNDSSGNEDATVTVGADTFTVAAATSTIGDANGRLTVAAALATFDSGTVCLTSGGLRTGYRDLAANAALTLAASDAGGTVVVRSTDTSTVAATMTALGAGSRIRVILVERTSTGSYTLAATYGTTAGTVTLNAQHEGVDLVYTGSIWRVEQLIAGATHA